jgi:hypothetical protein
VIDVTTKHVWSEGYELGQFTLLTLVDTAATQGQGRCKGKGGARARATQGQRQGRCNGVQTNRNEEVASQTQLVR